MVKLDKEFSVKTDSNNFELIRKYETTYTRNGEDKKTTVEDNWYCRDMTQALKLYFRECLRPAKDIKDLYDRILEVENNIEKSKNKV